MDCIIWKEEYCTASCEAVWTVNYLLVIGNRTEWGLSVMLANTVMEISSFLFLKLLENKLTI